MQDRKTDKKYSKLPRDIQIHINNEHQATTVATLKQLFQQTEMALLHWISNYRRK